MKRKYIWIFIILLAIYAVLSLSLPTDPQVLAKHNISQAKAHWLGLTITVPFVLIYLTALFGSVRVSNYANSVKASKEGPHLRKLASGLLILTFSLPIISIAKRILSYIALNQPHLKPETTIIKNYLGLLLAFAAFYMIGRGARGLYATLKNPDLFKPSYFLLIGPIILASVYTWLITAQNYNQQGQSAYFLPEWLVVTTLAIPYIFIWCIGLTAAYQIYKYKVNVKGSLYRHAFANLSAGMVFIVIVSVFIQLITTLSEQFNRLNLTPLLGVVYLLLVLYAVGFGLVARGAQKLKKIEDV